MLIPLLGQFSGWPVDPDATGDWFSSRGTSPLVCSNDKKSGHQMVAMLMGNVICIFKHRKNINVLVVVEKFIFINC
jgi:hypothetical protein